MKKTAFTIISFLIMNCLSAQITPANGIVYVATDGTGNGSSWASATSDLQGAIDAGGVEQVWVKSGTYLPTWNWAVGNPRAKAFKLKNNVKIYGGFNSTENNPTFEQRNPYTYYTILSGDLGVPEDPSDNAYTVILVFYYENLSENTLLDGFVIQDGNADGDDYYGFGGGARIDSGLPVFRDCTFKCNSAVWGGGLYIRDASPTLENCNITNNTASEKGGGLFIYKNSETQISNSFVVFNNANEGGGIYNHNNTELNIINTYISFNTAEFGGAFFNTHCSPTIISCYMHYNVADFGSAIYNTNQASPSIINCVLMFNISEISGGSTIHNLYSNPFIANSTICRNDAEIGGIFLFQSSPTIYNTIIWNETGNYITQEYSVPDVQYCCIKDGWIGGGVGNVTIDPEFAFEDQHYVKSTSFMIDRGNSALVPEGIDFDFDGNPRITGQNVDIGASEHRKIVYVRAGYSGGYHTGVDWDNAFSNLNDAISATQQGMQIWVAAGNYKPDRNYDVGTGTRYNHFPLRKGVSMYGGFAGNETSLTERNLEENITFLDGNLGSEKVYHVIYSTNSDIDTLVKIDGFTIRNGNANGTGEFRDGGNIYLKNAQAHFRNCQIYGGSAINRGGNIYLENSNSIFDDCAISGGESAYEGGAVAIAGSDVEFNYCRFVENYAAGNGGAVYLSGAGYTVFNSCLFWLNTAEYPGVAGGGAVHLSSFVMTLYFINCHFTENSASKQGGAIEGHSNMVIHNSTFDYNFVTDINSRGGNIHLGNDGSASFANSIIMNGEAETGENISVDEDGSADYWYSSIQGSGGSDNWNADFGYDWGNNLDYIGTWSTYEEAIDNNWQGINAGTNILFDEGGYAADYLYDYDKNIRVRGMSVDMGHREIPYAKLQVFLTPTESTELAEWNYDGQWHTNGAMLWETAKTVNISFSEVEGYKTPADTTFTLEWNTDHIVYGNYTIITNVQQLAKTNIKIYPNPTTGTINIDIDEVKQNDNIFIYNINGQLVQTIPAKERNNIDLSNFQTECMS
jgi:predicted outer membrane repeat protein